MTEKPVTEKPASPILAQIGVLNLSLNSTLSEFYKTLKMVMDVNNALAAENAKLNALLAAPKP